LPHSERNSRLVGFDALDVLVEIAHRFCGVLDENYLSRIAAIVARSCASIVA
jgi:hypothetical protein